MRILKLTPAVEKEVLRARHAHDAEAQIIASKIIRDVRRRGDAALSAWMKKFDHQDLRREPLWVDEDEIRAACKLVSRDFLRALQHAVRNVRRVAQMQLPRPWTLRVEPGVKISQVVRPIDSIGCYVPGGRFALLSTMMMTVVPAQVAGVRQIQVACPRPNAELLATSGALGITRVARMGGAQAIAALAYGTQRVPRVEKIFGPGNRFVTAAKQLVSSDCAIDLPAGPTEAIVLAANGNPCWIAADLLAQAEHAPDAGSFLVTTSRRLARQVQTEVALQLNKLPPANPARVSTQRAGAILVAASLREACDFVNRFAPEHLSLPGGAQALLKQVRAAGTVFLGAWGAQPLGDYLTGSNHVLPTGGWARKRGGLSAADFVKCINVQTITRGGFLRLAGDAETLAESEGLIAHRNAVRVRR
jgi:histidinol dehydrogenase